jgi:beta-glucanase (GH16 family)
MKKYILGFLIFLFFISPQVAYADPPGNQSDWIMTFSDEFNGNTLDHTKWGTTYRLGARTNNDELEWYVDNAHLVSDGTLKLIAKYETAQTGFPYTSGMISSKVDSGSPYIVNFSSTYGYFESRIKVPSGNGTWPAFWLLPAPGGWPPEIDIMEIHGEHIQAYSMTNHRSCDYPLVGGGWCDLTGFAYQLPVNDGDFSTSFHTFGVDWEPGLIIWYLDGVERFRTTNYVPVVNLDDPGGVTGMYIIANLAIGGGGHIPIPAEFPKQMEIDYIKVYQKKSFSCDRCSVVNGCERAQFQSWTADCAQPIPGSSVIRTTDCSCPQINGGDNSRCTPTCLPASSPTPSYPTGDLNSDGIVNIQDFVVFSSKFGTSDSTSDLNSDGIVNIQDFVIFSSHFGEMNTQ